MTDDRGAEIAQVARALFEYADASARLLLERDGSTLRFTIEQPDVFDAILEEVKDHSTPEGRR
jgi:hypothetical protein